MNLNTFGQNLRALTDSSMTQRTNIYYDSIQKNRFGSVDSVQNSLHLKLDSATIRFNKSIDSLNNLNLSSEKYTQKLDSAYRSFQGTVISRYKNHYDSLGLKTDRRLSSIDSIVSSRTHFLDSVLNSNGIKGIGERFNIDSKFDRGISEIPLGSQISESSKAFDVSQLSTVESSFGKGFDNPIPETSLPNVNINTGILEKFNSTQNSLEQLGNVTDQIKTVSSETDKIKNGEALSSLGKTVEDNALKLDDLQRVSEAKQSEEALKGQVESLKNVNSKPDTLLAIGKKEFIDHFAGKEEILNKELEDLAKVQAKYRNVADARFLPKRLPNEMKGKPFVERLIPGISFQVFRGDNVSFDLAPFLGYRFSGRILGGISGYKRIKYVERNSSFSFRGEDLFGVRLFGDFRIKQNLFAHLEIEYYKGNDERSLQVLKNEEQSDWKNKFNFGIYRSYKLAKNINGNFLILYDLFMIREFPNTRNASMRFGFDYKIKKKVKK